MSLLLLLVLAFIGVIFLWVGYVYPFVKKFDNVWNTGEVIPVMFSLLFLVITATAFSVMYIDYFEDTIRETEEHDWYIHSLGNDKYTEGDFFIGSGSIEEVDYYFFYVNTIKGMARIKRPVNDCYIIETDNRRPEIVGIKYIHDDKDKFFKVWFEDVVTEYKIYVPKGTIVKDFRVR